MTDTELSRVIAEFLKPMPTVYDWQLPQKCWVWSRHGWQPRDMINDPAMTVMLIRKIVADQPFKYSLEFFTDELVLASYSDKDNHGYCDALLTTIPMTNETLGRAVAEAFAKAHDLKVGKRIHRELAKRRKEK